MIGGEEVGRVRAYVSAHFARKRRSQVRRKVFGFITGTLEFPGRNTAKADRNAGVTHGSAIEMIQHGIGVLTGQQDTRRDSDERRSAVDRVGNWVLSSLCPLYTR